MKKFIWLTLLFSSFIQAQQMDTGAIINACGAVPRLYSVASLAAFDKDNTQWREATYSVATEIMIGNDEADRIIDSLRQNRDIANHFIQSGAGQADPQFMENCMLEPSKYIPSYQRLLRAGKLNSH